MMAVATYTPPPPQGVSKKTPDKADPGNAQETENSKISKTEKKTNDNGKAEEDLTQKPKKARIAAFGSALLASNKFYKLQGNPDLFMNTVSWLAEDENLISIRPKSVRSQPLVLKNNESLMVFLAPVILFPLAWIIAGIVVYARRRKPAKT